MVELVREPGGLKISEEIRSILLNPNNHSMNHQTEALLMIASRAQLTQEVIRPFLKKGKIVIADRFSDSTLAYQGGGRNLDIEILKKVNNFATKSLVPHITFLIDINPKDAIARAGKLPLIELKRLVLVFKIKFRKLI